MDNRILLAAVLILSVAFFIRNYKINKNKNAYIKRIREIFAIQFDPAKALTEIDKEISKSDKARVNTLLSDKAFALIWLGKWQEAEQVISSINQKKIEAVGIYSLRYNTLLLKFFSLNFFSIEKTYNTFISDENYKRFWKDSLELKILSCMNALYIEKDYEKYNRLFNELIQNNRISILYLGALYFYAGVSNLKLGNTEEAIKYFTRAVIFGEKTFLKQSAQESLEGIEMDNASLSSERKKTIEEYTRQASSEFKEYLIKCSVPEKPVLKK